MKGRLPLIEFVLLGVLVLALVGWFHPPHRLELLTYKATMAGIIGPAIGTLVHHLLVPGDRITHGDPDAQNMARWRRVAMIAVATLTVGVGL